MQKNPLMRIMKMTQYIKIGYDYKIFQDYRLCIPIKIPVASHLIVVGGSGSGKSTALLYWLRNFYDKSVNLFICDFKKSGEFKGITDHFAEFDKCSELISDFYKVFLETPEGGDGALKILLIDEIAGMLTHLSMTKEGKAKADEIRQIMSSILMLGRSRKCFLWLSMQRFTATIFPASSGAGDNFHCAVGLGRLTVDGRRGLFGSEELENEKEYCFCQGTGLVLMDGKPLQSLILPQLSKAKLLEQLQGRAKPDR